MISKKEFLEKKIKNLVKEFKKDKVLHVIPECKKILSKFPNIYYVRNLLGACYQKIGQFNNAIDCYNKIIHSDPKNLTAINNLANTYRSIYDYKNAEKRYLKLLNLDSGYFKGFFNYANLKNELNDFDKAIELYKKAIEIKPDESMTYFNLALVYASIGRMNDAKHNLEICLKINPNYFLAHHRLSRIIKYTKDDPHFNEMKKILHNNENVENINISIIYFALGKAYEDIGEFEKSIFHFKKGNEIKRQLIRYDLDNDKKKTVKIRSLFDKINLKYNSINDLNKKKIIFIVGMPRSGTTLVEQIISSHSKVYGSGELYFLEFLIKDSLYSDNLIDKILSSKLSIISNQYVDFLKNFSMNKEYVTDKNPLNFLYIGFIKILFPNAIIIHCKRNSKDTCLSIYKNLFEDNNLGWTYNQKELGQFYNLYLEMMSFWKSKFSENILEIDYENLVNNQEKYSKKIISDCGLKWEENCLKFYNNKRPIRTLSINQARQSIYKSSINISDKYKGDLKDLFETLDKISE